MHRFLNVQSRSRLLINSDLYSDEVTVDHLLVPVEDIQKLHVVEAASHFQLVGCQITW